MRSMSRAAAPPPAEEDPLLLALQKALQALLRKAQNTYNLTETASEVDAFCGCLEAVLQHKFKSKQFYMFTVHPWSLVEASESWVTPRRRRSSSQRASAHRTRRGSVRGSSSSSTSARFSRR